MILRKTQSPTKFYHVRAQQLKDTILMDQFALLVLQL